MAEAIPPQPQPGDWDDDPRVLALIWLGACKGALSVDREDDAQDIAQDVVVSVIQRRIDLRTIANPEAYGYTAGRNRGITQGRRNRNQPILVDFGGEPPHTGPATQSHEFDVLNRQMAQEVVNLAEDVLTQRQFDAFKTLLSSDCIMGEAIAFIQDETGLTRSAIRKLLQRALAKLEDEIDVDDLDDDDNEDD